VVSDFRKSCRLFLFCLSLCAYLAPCPASGQFTTVLNMPPDPNIGDNGSIGSDTQINLFNDGAIGNSFHAGASDGTSTNVEVNVSGGSVGIGFRAYRGSNVNISSGSVDRLFRAQSGSRVHISGGSIGSNFSASAGSDVRISGGSFGSEFVAFISRVMISGGTFGDQFLALDRSKVTITGGLFDVEFNALYGSTVKISGGSFGNRFGAAIGSLVNISGGDIGPGLRASGTINISGGSIGGDFNANSGSNVNLLGQQFILNGVDITNSLTENVPLTITDRDVNLSGLFADGMPFSFDLHSIYELGQDYFASSAHLTVTRVSEGDFNGDLSVDGLDFLRWQRGESPNPLSESDLSAWESSYGTVVHLAASASAVPESTSFALALTALCLALGRRRSF